MGVRRYEENGKEFWMVYVNLRSKEFPRIREQKRVLGIEEESAAHALDKKISRSLAEKVVKRETEGYTWDELLSKWELAMRTDPFCDLDPMTIQDRLAVLRKWTREWLGRAANDLR